MTAPVRNFSLIELRRLLEISQTDMSYRMGLSLRPYQELESGNRELRPRHVRLAESVALDVAIEQGNPELAPRNVREKAIRLAKLIMAQNIGQNARRLVEIILDES